jgi:acyl-CoA thioester hydrolase
MPRARTSTHRLRVRYDECDQQGVVFNSHYFAYFDVALTEAFRQAGFPYGELIAGGTDLMVAEAHARYRAPARFDDEIELEWWITRLGNTAMSTRIDVKRDGETLVEGEMRHVFVDLAEGGKRAIPDEVRRALEPYVEAAEADSGAATEARA